MSTIEYKLNAALNKDREQILRSFHVNPNKDHVNWDNFWDNRQQCKIIYETLIEIGYQDEANLNTFCIV